MPLPPQIPLLPKGVATPRSGADDSCPFESEFTTTAVAFTPPPRGNHRPSAPHLGHPDAPPPAPALGVGLLKRFKTRLAGTTSSQVVEKHAYTSSGPNPAVTLAPSPVPAPAPVPASSQQPQRLNTRLSLAALAERRAEKREAKAREEQRATDARRRAALAKTGLLPASRRYSLVDPPQGYGTDASIGPPFDPFDPFAKDRVRREEGDRERRSLDGVVVQEPKPVDEPEGGGLSAAEAVVRQWREKNASPRVSDSTPSSSSESKDATQVRTETTCDEQSRAANVNDGINGGCLAPEGQDETHVPSGSEQNHDASSSSPENCRTDNLRVPLPIPDADKNISVVALLPVLESAEEPVSPAPQQADPPSHEKEKGSERDRKEKFQPSLNETSASRVTPAPAPAPRPENSERTQRELELVPPSPSKRSTIEEKKTLNSWKFPPGPQLTISPSTSDSSGTTTPVPLTLEVETNLREPVANAGALLRSEEKPLPAPLMDARPPPPPPPKKQEIIPVKAKENEREDTPQQESQTLLSVPPPPSFPSQVPLPASPTLAVSLPPPPASSRTRSRHRASTSPPAFSLEQHPGHNQRNQKHVNGVLAANSNLRGTPLSILAPKRLIALTVSLPALSPTTSTATSTSNGSGSALGSALPRTPSTSSHERSPVRVLETPLENEEDALLLHEDGRGQEEEEESAVDKVKVTDVKEFVQLANLVEDDDDDDDECKVDGEGEEVRAEEGYVEKGELPPLPLALVASASASASASSSGALTPTHTPTPAVGAGESPSGAKEQTTKGANANVAVTVTVKTNDKRADKRKTLFGRRRRATTQNVPPAITIPDGSSTDDPNGVNQHQHQQHQQHQQQHQQLLEPPGSGRLKPVSSFSNLKRTVTSVTAGFGFCGGGVGVGGARSRSKSPTPTPTPTPMPMRGATVPARAPPNAPSASALSTPRSDTDTDMTFSANNNNNSSSSNNNNKSKLSSSSSSSPLVPIPNLNETCAYSANSNSRTTGVGLRRRRRRPPSFGVGVGSGPPGPGLNPTMHSRGSILVEMNAIEDDESRRLAELAFLH